MGIQRVQLCIYIKSFSCQRTCTKAAISQHTKFFTFLISKAFALKRCFFLLFQWSGWKTLWSNPTGWRDFLLPGLRSKGYLQLKVLWWAFGWYQDELVFSLTVYILFCSCEENCISERAVSFARSNSSEQEPGTLAELLLQCYPPAFSSPCLVSQKEKLVPVPDLCWQTCVYFCTWLWHWGTLVCSLMHLRALP